MSEPPLVRTAARNNAEWCDAFSEHDPDALAASTARPGDESDPSLKRSVRHVNRLTPERHAHRSGGRSFRA
jgi:hypothetical protein